jgi:F-type H+-transporting ATPase subunit alpha
MKVVDQVMIIFAGSKGYLDKVARNQVAAWEEQFLKFMQEQASDVRNQLIKDRKFNPQNEEMLHNAIKRFVPQFKPK